MRLAIISVLITVLTVGGFFGYKLYQRSQMKSDAIEYLETSLNRHRTQFGDDATARLMDLLLEEADEAFAKHYRSGGFTKPAEFDEIPFTRVVYERVYERSKVMELDEQTKQFAEWMYSQSRPLSRRGAGTQGENTNNDPARDPDGEE
ncbi:MAG: hypothetical protein ACIAQF_01830 [Phycisphaerales bacterium JB065]